MECHYFQANVCRSCTYLETPYAVQLSRKQDLVSRRLAGPSTAGVAWLPPVASRDEGFRNKAKMVASGTTEAPLLGLIDADLVGCPIHEPGLRAALPRLRAFITEAGLTPYSIPDDTGELKHVLTTVSPDGELLVRFVLRSHAELARIEDALPRLLTDLPIAVASVNIQPVHQAIIEGPEEIVLHGSTLTMRVNDVALELNPRSFFQTNTEIAAALYRHAQEITDRVVERAKPSVETPFRIWDLYCGVGGFARHLEAPGREVTGVDTVTGPPWVSADATEWFRDALRASRPPMADLVVVNPPRRGIGELAGLLEASGVTDVLYSSCNVDSLIRDLSEMPSMIPLSARLLDMFPHTDHHEVLLHLVRG